MVSTVFFELQFGKQNLRTHIIVGKMMSSDHLKNSFATKTCIRLKNACENSHSSWIRFQLNGYFRKMHKGRGTSYDTYRLRQTTHHTNKTAPNVRFPFDEFCTRNSILHTLLRKNHQNRKQLNCVECLRLIASAYN